MDDFEKELKETFLNEALMDLEEVESSFLELETSTNPTPLIERIFRLAHNMKGGSVAAGFDQVAKLTHELESLVLKIQKNEIPLNAELISTLLRSNDKLVEMHIGLKADMNAQFENADVISEIKGWLSGKPVTVIALVKPNDPFKKQAPEEFDAFSAVPSADAFFAESNPSTEIYLGKENDKLDSSSQVAKSFDASKVYDVQEPKHKDNEIIRVNIAKIDALNDYVGELIVLQTVVAQQSNGYQSDKLQASIRQMAKLSKDIQSISMSLRMLPFKPLVQKFQRVVRDTAQALQKEVVLEVIGENLDIDKSVLDKLADPLIHILRNAVDHGLECVHDRSASEKCPEGKIQLTILNKGNHLLVEVSDDGKGIDLDVIRAKAIEKKVILESQQLTEKQTINLIFHPGFSTKAEVTEISGRGVGMDVVKTNIEKMGGTIEVKTELGKGSTITMHIPLTLAVIDGIVVSSAKNRYVLPISQVQETINLSSQKIHSGKIGIGSCIELRGVVIPLVSIEEALNVKTHGQAINAAGTALIIEVNEKLIALVVDDIIKLQQIVIKPFGNGLVAQSGWIGSCVLGDGLPTLILSPTELLNSRIVSKSLDIHSLEAA